MQNHLHDFDVGKNFSFLRFIFTLYFWVFCLHVHVLCGPWRLPWSHRQLWAAIWVLKEQVKCWAISLALKVSFKEPKKQCSERKKEEEEKTPQSVFCSQMVVWMPLISGGRGKHIFLSSRPVWITDQVPGQVPKNTEKPCPKQTNKQTKMYFVLYNLYCSIKQNQHSPVVELCFGILKISVPPTGLNKKLIG